MDRVQLIIEEIERRQEDLESRNFHSMVSEYDDFLSFINSLPEEPTKHKPSGVLKGMLDNLDPVSLENTRQTMIKEAEDDDLEEEIQRHLKDCLDVKFPTTDIESIKKDVECTARHFAKWQKEQFEKNRLAACDAQTPEEAEREMNFVEHIIKEEHRQPTYSDAIEYGMRLQKQKDNQDDSDMAVIAHLDGVESGKAIMKEQMMKEAVEGIIIISHGEKVVLHPSRHGKAEMSLPDEIIDKYGIDDKVKIIFIKEE